MRLHRLPLLAVTAFLLFSAGECLAQAPANDNFANATVITGNPAAGAVTATGTSVNATKEANEPNHAGVPGGASIWFRWTAPSSGTVAIDLAGSTNTVGAALDTIMGVYLGSAVDSLGLIAVNDDGDHDTGVGQPSKVVYNAVAGSVYQIAVDGYPLADNTIPTGTVSLRITAVTPPVNDSFDSAIDLGNNSTVLRSGDPHRDSTIEAGEPFHGANSFGTTWYTWTAPEDGASSIQLSNGTTRPSLVAVYTGDAVGALTLVGNGLTGSETLFSTIAGTTYRIAVAGLYFSGAQTRGDITLSIGKGDARPVASFRFGESWQWLHPTDGVDPAVADLDFNSTWHNPTAGYDGPPFAAAQPALLGYGAIGASAIETNIVEPISGNRYTAYFLRDFNLADPIERPVLELLADDGAIIYIDGVEVGRINVTGADSFLLTADDATNTEDRNYKVAIGPLAAGDHTIAVSVHNAGPTSSDLGFDMRMLEGVRFLGNVELANTPLCTGFQDVPAGSTLYSGRTNGDELGWSTAGGITIDTDGSEFAFELTNTTGVRFETERIDVSDDQNLVASIDMRAVDLTTGFEATDFFHVYVEGSFDGLTFEPVADIFARLTGGSPDPFEIYRSDVDYTTFTTQPGAIPDGLVSVRIVVEGTVDSTNEHIIIDNLCLESGAAPIKILAFSANQIDGLNITIQTEVGHLYELQSSTDLGRADAWASAALSELAENETLTFDLAGPLSDSEIYFRVVDLGED